MVVSDGFGQIGSLCMLHWIILLIKLNVGVFLNSDFLPCYDCFSVFFSLLLLPHTNALKIGRSKLALSPALSPFPVLDIIILDIFPFKVRLPARWIQYKIYPAAVRFFFSNKLKICSCKTNHISVLIVNLSHVFDCIQYNLSRSFVFQTFAKVKETLGLFFPSFRFVQALS